MKKLDFPAPQTHLKEQFSAYFVNESALRRSEADVDLWRA